MAKLPSQEAAALAFAEVFTMVSFLHERVGYDGLRRIITLQREGALSVAEVASRTGLSTTTCWRRIQQMEQHGVIRGRVALLDRSALGLDVTIFAHVKLSTQGRDAIAAFAEAIRERPEVLDCYTTMGEWDFMLRVVTREGYPGWMRVRASTLVRYLSTDVHRMRMLTLIDHPVDDIAAPIVFLCSDLARHITGEIVNVNGGAVLCG